MELVKDRHDDLQKLIKKNRKKRSHGLDKFSTSYGYLM